MRKGNHGGDWAAYQAKHDALPRLDFSANVSPLGPPEGVKQAMREAIEHVARTVERDGARAWYVTPTETLLGARVHLDLHVTVLGEWQDDPKKLNRLGY